MYSNRSVSQRSLLDLHSVYNLFNSKYLDKWSARFQSPDCTRWKAQCSRTCSFKYRANEQAAAVLLQTCEGRSHTIQLTLSYCCHKRICNAIFQSGSLCSFYCFHKYHRFFYSWSNARVLILWAVMDAVKKKKKTNHKEHECLHQTVWQTVFCLHQEPQPVNLTMAWEEVRAKQEPLPMIFVLHFFLVRPVCVEWFFRMTDWFCLC